VFVGELGFIGLILLCMLICMCRCCCCQKKRKSKGTKLGKMNKAEKERLLGDASLPAFPQDAGADEESQVSSTPVTDQRRSQMREKWGIGKDKNVNQ